MYGPVPPVTFIIAVPNPPIVVGFITVQVTPIGCTVTTPHSLTIDGLVVVVVAIGLEDGVFVLVGVCVGVDDVVGVGVSVVVGVLVDVMVGVGVLLGVLVGVNP